MFGKRSCIKPDTLGCSVSLSVTTYSYRTQWYMSSNTDAAVQMAVNQNRFDNLFNRFRACMHACSGVLRVMCVHV